MIEGTDLALESQWVKLFAKSVGDDYVQHMNKILEDKTASLQILKSSSVLETSVIYVDDCPQWYASVAKRPHTFLCPELRSLADSFEATYKLANKNRTLTFLSVIVRHFV